MLSKCNSEGPLKMIQYLKKRLGRVYFGNQVNNTFSVRCILGTEPSFLHLTSEFCSSAFALGLLRPNTFLLPCVRPVVPDILCKFCDLRKLYTTCVNSVYSTCFVLSTNSVLYAPYTSYGFCVFCVVCVDSVDSVYSTSRAQRAQNLSNVLKLSRR